ncbi:hypothetical protein HJG60_011371 [Phyllostomus discolor]|uniref:Uncharacterized protein n=1 Tax=Phyllostomus discolor TaxID=89673 RepID=A0A834E5C9_9CHIR|nr:hypothetical protein HJG60_011371 [Phyllostomus discolor]
MHADSRCCLQVPPPPHPREDLLGAAGSPEAGLVYRPHSESFRTLRTAPARPGFLNPIDLQASDEGHLKQTSFGCNASAWGEARNKRRGHFQLPRSSQQSHPLASLGVCPGLSSAGPKPTIDRGGHSEPPKPPGLHVWSCGYRALLCLKLTPWLGISHLPPGPTGSLSGKGALVCDLPSRWSCGPDRAREKVRRVRTLASLLLLEPNSEHETLGISSAGCSL